MSKTAAGPHGFCSLQRPRRVITFFISSFISGQAQKTPIMKRTFSSYFFSSCRIVVKWAYSGNCREKSGLLSPTWTNLVGQIGRTMESVRWRGKKNNNGLPHRIQRRPYGVVVKCKQTRPCSMITSDKGRSGHNSKRLEKKQTDNRYHTTTFN